jgi:hypothetical protein
VLPDYLRVTTFAPEANGFAVRFNRAFDVAVLNLYDGLGASGPAGLGAADVLLSTLGGANQAGSLLLDADQKGFAFVRTGATLAAGDYRATLVSGAGALRDLQGRPMDGDGNGASGGNAVFTFGVAAPGPVLSIADAMRGPGQALNVPAASTGMPIRLSGAGVVAGDEVAFELAWDESLLTVSNVVAPAGSGHTVTWSLLEPGRIAVRVVLAAPVEASGGEVARLIATVPATAPYGATHRLDLSAVQVIAGGGTQAAQDDDGVHLVGYLGDTTGDGRYGNDDWTRLQRIPVNADTGFAAYPLTDPTLVGDFNRDGRINAADVLILRAEINGVDRPEIPPLPSPLPVLTFATLTSVGESPVPPPFVPQAASFLGPQGLAAESVLSFDVSDAGESETERTLRTATLPKIEWKAPVVATQPGSSYGARPEWLKSFVGNAGGGTAGGGLQPFSFTL